MVNPRYLLLSDPDTALKIHIVTSTDYVDRITSELFALGVFEPIQQEAKERELKEIKEYIDFLEGAKKLYDEISAYIKQPITIEITEMPPEVRKYLEKLYNELSNTLLVMKTLDNEVSNKRRIISILTLFKQLVQRVLERYPDADISILHHRGSIYYIETFISSKQSLNLLQNRAMFTIDKIEDERYTIVVLLFSSKEYSEVIKSLPPDVEIVDVEKYGCNKLSDLLRRIDIEIENLNQDIARIVAKMDETLNVNLTSIAMLKFLLDIEYRKVEVWRSALSSKYLTVVTGWSPKSRIRNIMESLAKLPVYIMYEEDPNPPVEFNNLRPFKPFELITEMYGVPSPNEWDPTPFLTYSFIFFFSLMFADIGYGIGLALATKFILPKFVDNPRAPGFRRLQQVLYISSVGCIVLGVLSQSFLGSLLGFYLPIPRVLDYLDLMSMMGLSITIGYVFILIAHVFAAAKSFKLGDRGGVLSEIGIVLIMIAGAQYLRPHLYNYFRVGIPMIPIVYEYSLWLSLVAIGIIIAGKFISLRGLGALLWLFDVVGIIGDVFSFIRIAGIGMGSVMLAEIFNGFVAGAFTIGMNINIGIGIALGVIMAFVLHVFNLAVSAIGPFVHSLRLCLFEISSKFLEGAGRRIQPIKIVLGPTTLGFIKA